MCLDGCIAAMCQPVLSGVQHMQEEGQDEEEDEEDEDADAEEEARVSLGAIGLNTFGTEAGF